MTTRNIKGQRLSLLLSSCPLEYLIFLLYFSRVLITSYKTLISIITAKQLFLAFPLKNDASHTQHADYTHAPPHTHTEREHSTGWQNIIALHSKQQSPVLQKPSPSHCHRLSDGESCSLSTSFRMAPWSALFCHWWAGFSQALLLVKWGFHFLVPNEPPETHSVYTELIWGLVFSQSLTEGFLLYFLISIQIGSLGKETDGIFQWLMQNSVRYGCYDCSFLK